MISCTATTALAINAPLASVVSNHISLNSFTGPFTAIHNLISESNNGITYPDRYVQGVSATSRAAYIGSGNFQSGNYASGMYAISPSVSGMPQNGFTWSVIISHNEDVAGSGGGPYWTCTATRLDSPTIIYTGGVYGGTWKGWSQVTAGANSDRYVQGASATSRATYLGSGNFQSGNYASGMYAITPSVTGMPQDGFTWSVIIAHNEDGSGGGGGPYWTCTATRVDAPYIIHIGGVNNEVWQGWSQVFTTPPPSAPISTTGWVAGTYYEVKAPGTLASNKVYILKLAFSKQGTDEIVATYLVPITSTYSGSGSITISGNTSSHQNVGRTFTVRLKPGPGLRGIEVSPSHNDMADGTLTVAIVPLL